METLEIWKILRKCGDVMKLIFDYYYDKCWHEEFHGIWELVGLEVCCSKYWYSHEMRKLTDMHEMWNVLLLDRDWWAYIYLVKFHWKRVRNCDNKGKNCVEIGISIHLIATSFELRNWKILHWIILR